MKLLVIILTITLLAITSCDTTNPKPPEEKPEGYQEDIPWPSLANSPWPMYHGNPMGTGRLNGTIPAFSKIEKTFDNYVATSGAVVGEDSCFYFVAAAIPSGLVCFTPLGEKKWIYELPRAFYNFSISTPLVTKNGDIIFGYPRTDSVYSISSKGELNWRVALNCDYELNIGKDGTIYSYSKEPTAINAISKDGELMWTLQNNYFKTFSAMAISPDGNSLYSPGVLGVALLAVDLNSQSIKWQIDGIITPFATPLVDSQGNVYVVLTKTEETELGLFSYTPEGKLRWKVILNEGEHSVYSPTMDRYGNIYVNFKNLYSIDYEGNILWKKDFQVIPNELLIDEMDNILFVEREFVDDILSLIQINTKGEVVNQIALPNSLNFQYYSPAINYHSILLPLTNTNKLLYIK